MSTIFIPCAFCGDEIGSAHDMVIMAEQDDNITMAAHPDCYAREESERLAMEAEYRRDAMRENFPDWDSR